MCTAFKPCRPEFRVPGSGFRVLLACGSSCWRAVALIPQTFSLNTGDPAQPGAPISRAGPVEARPGGAVPGHSRPGPAAPSRASRGPARRCRPGPVEARPGGAVPGQTRPGPTAATSRGGRGPARGRSPGVVEAAKATITLVAPPEVPAPPAVAVARSSRGPTRRHRTGTVEARPGRVSGPVEARAGGAVQGWSRQRSALASAKNVLVANKWLHLLLH